MRGSRQEGRRYDKHNVKIATAEHRHRTAMLTDDDNDMRALVVRSLLACRAAQRRQQQQQRARHAKHVVGRLAGGWPVSAKALQLRRAAAAAVAVKRACLRRFAAEKDSMSCSPEGWLQLEGCRARARIPTTPFLSHSTHIVKHPRPAVCVLCR